MVPHLAACQRSQNEIVEDVVLVAAARTPFGKLGGGLSALAAPDLGAVVIKEVLDRGHIDGGEVDQVIMGTVITAGMGQIPARQAAIKAGLPTSVPALSINKVCASSLKALNLAALLIRNGDAEVVVAGGMENMSLAPYLLEKARFGYRLGDGPLVDSMVRDGLTDPANGCHMAVEGSDVAKEFEVSRERQDAYAFGSQQRYAAALTAGRFNDELVPVAVANSKGTTTISADEQPRPDTSLVEINEAFAAVACTAMDLLGIDEQRVNVDGGALAVGHPIGASGARILMHLAYELRRRGGGYGAAGICSGMAQGEATIIRVPRT